MVHRWLKRSLSGVLKALTISFLVTIFSTTVIPLGRASQKGELPAPTGLKVIERTQDAGKRIALTWNPVPGAFGYRVYRAERAEGPFQSVGGKAADSMIDYPVFLDDTAEAGKDYFYAVTTVDEEGRESSFSNPVSARLNNAFQAATGPKSIILSLADQRLYFYEGNQLVNVMRCSTGLNNATPTGNFRILNHLGTHGGLGGAICDYWMSFTPRHGIHAWPRGLSNYDQALGAPASHGCVRLHPLEAYWPYYWAPDGTPFTIIASSISRKVISGCHDSIGAQQLSYDWYFAEGFTAYDFDTYLLLSNPNDTGTNVATTFLLEGGGTVEKDIWIAPHSRFTLGVDSVPMLGFSSFSIHVHSFEAPLVAERAMYFIYSGGRSDGSVTIGTTALSSDWYFSEGYTAGDFDTFLLLANPGEQSANTEVSFMLENGNVVTRYYSLVPKSRFTIGVDEMPELSRAAFATHVHSNVPLVAERAMYFRKGYLKGGHATIGSPELSKVWYFAEGCTSSIFENYLLLGNPSGEGTTVNIDFLLADGSISRSYWMGPHSRLTLPVHAMPELRSRDMAFVISADRPIVAERAMYDNFFSERGGHASVGARTLSTKWYFAEGFTGNRTSSFNTFLLLANPSPTIAAVEVQFHREDGAVFTYHYQIPPQRRITVSPDSFPGLESCSLSIVVDSGTTPIVAERAMYFIMCI